uniref:Uncharacterized protein n=1 Tax=Globisporangium ultimum (strain ATCC 200006 / CBS 805.95 / DAOM BR144) TaxID=431595 RepID=K3WXK5_GLOUD
MAESKAPSAAHAWSIAVPHAMVAFCDFLEHCVLTKNLALLRCMVRDFYAGHDQTLQEFIELGVNLVAVLSFEQPGHRNQKIAAQLLLQQQQERQRPPADSPRATPCMFLYLLARVGTKHMSWLKSICNDFCDGRQEMLVEFVRMGTQTISILPVNLLVCEYQRHWPVTPPYLSPAFMMPMSHDGGKHAGSDEFGRRSPRAPESCDEAAATRQRRLKLKKRAAPPILHDPSDEEDGVTLLESLNLLLVRKKKMKTQMMMHREASEPHAKAKDTVTKDSGTTLEQIRAMFTQVEASEPWNYVFHDKLELPMDESQHKVLASTLRRFLAIHGRAMWEWSFWMPYDADSHLELQSARTKRQTSTKKIFMRRVMGPAFRELGPAFFADLDTRLRGHEGWWCRRPIVDLGHVASNQGVAVCIDYIQTQQRARFPVVDEGYKPRQFRGHYNWSDSMWSCDGALRHALDEIRCLKGTNDDDQDNANEQNEGDLSMDEDDEEDDDE